jgi:signal transduction histidine kinase
MGEATIGLQLARHCIDLHGGTISAQNAGEGGGTTLTVTLPVTPPPTEDDAF